MLRWNELAENRTGWRQAVKKGVRSFEVERLKARADERQKRKVKEALNIKKSNKILLVLTLCVRFVAEPANQELVSTATSEPIHNKNTEIIEIDESTTILKAVTSKTRQSKNPIDSTEGASECTSFQ